MIRCRICGFEMAMNLSMTWNEQIEKGCPSCNCQEEWWTGWPSDGGPWEAGDWQEFFETERDKYLAEKKS